MWADKEADLDLLGFDFLVDGLVIALTEPRLLPLTIGLLGDWGSGKSSLMRLAASELAKEHQEPVREAVDVPPAPYLTVDFSPWQYEDYENVKKALMNAVLDAVEQRVPNAADEIGRLRAFVRGIKDVGRKLGRAGAGAAPVLVPLLVQGAAPDLDPNTLAAVGAMTGALAREAHLAPADPSAQPAQDATTRAQPITNVKDFRNELRLLIDRAPYLDAVVVFIDDLDRCFPETIVDTFEAIRLFLNTPKTAYVLALNQSVVESAIDSRYPELKKADGGGIGRDYLEKMLQLKIAIPPLSAPEAETYANLLFAELHLDAHQFGLVVAKANENRALSGLSVAFNTGIAGELLGDIPLGLATDLEWAANIMPVLGVSLRGNPRQLKRFLNNLLLKHRSAARRGVDLKLPELAKLLVLEDQYNSDFQKLFDWQLGVDGPSPELREAEDHARAGSLEPALPGGDAADPKPRTIAKQVSKSPPATAGEPRMDVDVRAWAEKPHVAEWLRVDPPLRAVDLRPYFTYSRDKLSFGVSASRLAPHLQVLLGKVQSETEPYRRSHYQEVADLAPAGRAQFIQALLERVQRHPGGVALTATLEIAEQNPDVVDTVCSSLSQIPPTSLPSTAGGMAVRRLPAANPSVVALLDHWAASENAPLKRVLRSARNAQSRK